VFVAVLNFRSAAVIISKKNGKCNFLTR
jgi:hypothetical protein